MGDKEEVRVVTEALRMEASKWRRLADDMEVGRANADRLDLSAPAFHIGDMVSTGVHSSAYEHFQAYMVGLFAGAVTEFDQLGTALDAAAELYDATDGKSAIDLTRIYGQ